MNDDRYWKYGAATGIAFVVLMVVGFLIVTPQPPDLDAPAGEWTKYYSDHQDAIRAAAVLVTGALFFFLWFLGSVSTALRVAIGNPRLPTIAFGGGLIAIATLGVAVGINAVAAYRPEELSPDTTRMLNDVFVMMGVPAIAGLVAFFGATALVVIRTDVFPDWLGWLVGLAAVVQPLTFGALFTKTGAFAGDGALGLFVPILVGIIAIIALSIELMQHSEEVRGPGLTDRLRGAVSGAAEGAVTGAAAGAQGKRTERR